MLMALFLNICLNAKSQAYIIKVVMNLLEKPFHIYMIGLIEADINHAVRQENAL